MSENGEGPRIEQSGPSRRDDTPSFIRDVQSRRDVLNPALGENISVIPVMEVPRGIRIWRQIRWPLLGLLVVIVLTVVGVITNSIMVSRNVAGQISDARRAESFGAIEAVISAGRSLEQLVDAYPSRSNAQAAWAWHAVLEATWFGPQQELAAKARAALEAADASDPSAVAAQAGILCLEGKPAEALVLLDEVSAQPEPRLALARAWTQAALGETDRALEIIELAVKAFPGYVPLVIEGMRTAFFADDVEETTRWMTRLNELLPDHLWASLVHIAFELPRWGEAQATRDKGQALVLELTKLAPQIEAAPFGLRLLGQVLRGRAMLAVNDASQAADIFAKVLEIAPTAENLAWYGLAMMLKDAPRAAIEIIEEHRELRGIWVQDAQAQALLALHRVDDARPLVEQIEKSGKLRRRAAQLGFVLAVREGDVDKALERMPERLQGEMIWPALELYEQAAQLGRQKDVFKIIGAISQVDPVCSNVLRNWHSRSDHEAIRSLSKRSEDSPCAAALRAKFLFGRDDPREVAKAAEIAVAATHHDLSMRLLRGLARFLVDGKDAGVAVLDQILAAQPQGLPLRIALARAYLRMGAADKALAAVDGNDSDQALALRIDASPDQAQTALITEATKRFEAHPSPILAYYAALGRQRANKHSEVVALAEAIVPEAGMLAPRLGALVARSMNFLGRKRDADRLLEQLTRSLRGPAGCAAAWEAMTELVLLNLRRGGKYTFRALSLISERTSQGVRSADLLYAFAMANYAQGNERGAPRFLREALEIDPSHVQTCQQLAAMGKLDDTLRAACLKTRPALKL